MLVEAEIWTVARTDKGNAVLIKPLGSDRAVPIFIGQLEAQSILIGLGRVPMPRPLTHDLLLSILEKMHLSVERIEINDLKDATFYARIIAKQGMKRFVFDSRPSDAIALASRTKCPVYIAEYIIDEASIPISMISDADQMTQNVNQSVMEELQRALQAAVEEENYEEAARIRDRIREVEEENEQSSASQSNDDTDDGESSIFRDEGEELIQVLFADGLGEDDDELDEDLEEDAEDDEFSGELGDDDLEEDEEDEDDEDHDEEDDSDHFS